MSGFFRSLAEHAVVPGLRVRPVVPPAPIGLTPDHGWDLEQEAPAPVPLDARLSAAAPEGDVPAAVMKQRARPAGGAQPVREASTRPAETSPRDRLQSQPDRTAVTRPEAISELSPAQSGVTREVLVRPVERAEPAEPAIASRPHEQRRPADAPRVRVRSRPASHRESPPAFNRHAEPGADPRADTAPDVQIHIGRIELTAVTTPPATRRHVPAARPAMGLADYLRQRDGKPR